MDEINATATTMMAGTLALTVWPDTPLGEHQRYAYRITDTTGQSLQGRDLFTGSGAPVAPAEAIRDLAAFLAAAGEARQYALDHPGTAPEKGSLFPAWVADAARANADALTDITDLDGHEAVATVGSQRWISVVFLQGTEADEVLALIERSGADAAIQHLARYDYGEETVQAALENGYIYDVLPTGTVDEVSRSGVYTLSYNHHLGHVSLLRDYDTPAEPALGDPALRAPVPSRIETTARPAPQQTPDRSLATRREPPDPAAGAGRFSHSRRPQRPGRGLSL